MKANIEQAGEYIFNNGILYKWGAGAGAVSTEVADKQRAYIIHRFNLSNIEFSEAFAHAESLDRKESQTETAFLKSHPELNPNQFSCDNCHNTDRSKAFHYDGLLGYEAIICLCCGTYYDVEGKHEKDSWSAQYMPDPTGPKLFRIHASIDKPNGAFEVGVTHPYSADELEAKKAELIAHGYTITDVKEAIS